MLSKFFDHFKRYFLLGIFALVPAALTFVLFKLVYNRLDEGVERLLPAVFNKDTAWVHISLAAFTLYFVGIVCSYILGQRVVKPVSKKIASIFPHVQDMNRELKMARQIHETIIPDPISSRFFEIAVDYIPCNVIGGDFVQYHFRDEKKLVFIIGDVTGHGLPSALLANRLHMEFERQIQKGKSPGVIMKEANDFIVKAFKGTNMYFSGFCGLADMEKGELVYSSYGHLPQILFQKKADKLIELPAHAAMLGLMEEGGNGVLQSKQSLEHGDRLVLFTDGIPETLRAGKERYGSDRFMQDIRKYGNVSGTVFQKDFLESLWNFTKQEYEDDVCLMTIDVK